MSKPMSAIAGAQAAAACGWIGVVMSMELRVFSSVYEDPAKFKTTVHKDGSAVIEALVDVPAQNVTQETGTLSAAEYFARRAEGAKATAVDVVIPKGTKLAPRASNFIVTNEKGSWAFLEGMI